MSARQLLLILICEAKKKWLASDLTFFTDCVTENVRTNLNCTPSPAIRLVWVMVVSVFRREGGAASGRGGRAADGGGGGGAAAARALGVYK
ncbi:hypothetical protein EVAR_12083_1 [Eumeta japonica]|uniref:Uncharacterized protein n=1 Tax=Eumeta variegata TaxID=151549 RepID=A0A4C1U554_EUMVA|nr:hypothetical protein EVAR_12083_1 [Eumeta japonica]